GCGGVCWVGRGGGMRRPSWAPSASIRQGSTPVAFSEKIAKLTPEPSHVAPRGSGLPGRVLMVWPRDGLHDNARRSRAFGQQRDLGGPEPHAVGGVGAVLGRVVDARAQQPARPPPLAPGDAELARARPR